MKRFFLKIEPNAPEVLDKSFQPSLMFAGNAGACQSGAPSL